MTVQPSYHLAHEWQIPKVIGTGVHMLTQPPNRLAQPTGHTQVPEAVEHILDRQRDRTSKVILGPGIDCALTCV